MISNFTPSRKILLVRNRDGFVEEFDVKSHSTIDRLTNSFQLLVFSPNTRPWGVFYILLAITHVESREGFPLQGGGGPRHSQSVNLKSLPLKPSDYIQKTPFNKVHAGPPFC